MLYQNHTKMIWKRLLRLHLPSAFSLVSPLSNQPCNCWPTLRKLLARVWIIHLTLLLSDVVFYSGEVTKEHNLALDVTVFYLEVSNEEERRDMLCDVLENTTREGTVWCNSYSSLKQVLLHLGIYGLNVSSDVNATYRILIAHDSAPLSYVERSLAVSYDCPSTCGYMMKISCPDAILIRCTGWIGRILKEKWFILCWWMNESWYAFMSWLCSWI